MSLKLVELNDTGLRVFDGRDLILESPGFALIEGERMEFGQSARDQSRLFPTATYHWYWQQLGLESLPAGENATTAGLRHNADIAWAHLRQLGEEAGLTDEVVLAVPGSFSREQLGILLGLIRQLPFRAVGLVDSALLPVLTWLSGQARKPSVLLHVELQLHQLVLTRLRREGDDLRRDAVAVIPGAGEENILDSVLQLATEAFIQQCRFNPQHNAESEQMISSRAPAWLSQPEETLLLEVEHGTAVHQARLPRASVGRRLQSVYGRAEEALRDLLQEVDAEHLQVLLSHRMEALPGIRACLEKAVYGPASPARPLEFLDPAACGAGALLQPAELISDAEALPLVTGLALPSGASAGAAGRAEAQNGREPREEATHILVGSVAREVGTGLALNDLLPAESRDGFGPARIEARPDGLWLISPEEGLRVNGRPAEGEQSLRPGDRLTPGAGQGAGPVAELQLIRVVSAGPERGAH